jgi:flagellar secretion chaperone FliS
VSSIARNAYRQMSLETASPAKVIVMLYDRLAFEIKDARQALASHRPANAHFALKRGQEIVWGLDSALDTSRWPEGEQLRSVYVWLTEQLIEANLKKSDAPLDACLPIVESLADAWRQAVMNVASPTGVMAGSRP